MNPSKRTVGIILIFLIIFLLVDFMVVYGRYRVDKQDSDRDRMIVLIFETIITLIVGIALYFHNCSSL